jgi:hypothetical protein
MTFHSRIQPHKDLPDGRSLVAKQSQRGKKEYRAAQETTPPPKAISSLQADTASVSR